MREVAPPGPGRPAPPVDPCAEAACNRGCQGRRSYGGLPRIQTPSPCAPINSALIPTWGGPGSVTYISKVRTRPETMEFGPPVVDLYHPASHAATRCIGRLGGGLAGSLPQPQGRRLRVVLFLSLSSSSSSTAAPSLHDCACASFSSCVSSSPLRRCAWDGASASAPACRKLRRSKARAPGGLAHVRGITAFIYGMRRTDVSFPSRGSRLDIQP